MAKIKTFFFLEFQGPWDLLRSWTQHKSSSNLTDSLGKHPFTTSLHFDSYLEKDNHVDWQNIIDNSIHACLYFIWLTGHSYVVFSPLLFPLSIEHALFLFQILADIAHHKIQNEDKETFAEAEEIANKILSL